MALPTAADVSGFLQGASLKRWTPESLSESTLASDLWAEHPVAILVIRRPM